MLSNINGLTFAAQTTARKTQDVVDGGSDGGVVSELRARSSPLSACDIYTIKSLLALPLQRHHPKRL